MDEIFLRDIAPVIEAANQRTQQLIEAIVPQIQIDWTTGRVQVADRSAVARSIRELTASPGADEIANSFLATLDDGFAVRPSGPGPNDPAFRPIPWRSLSHVYSVEAMTVEDWEWLGIRENSTIEQAREALAEFEIRPDYMLSDEHISMLRDAAESSLPILRATPQFPPRPADFTPFLRVAVDTVSLGLRQTNGGGDGGNGNGKKPPPPPPPPPPPGPDYAKLATEILNFIKEIADCLAHAQWSIQWAWIYPLGVRVCLDPTCTDRVVNALKGLLGTSAGDLIQLIGSLVLKGALTWANLLSGLGWLGLAILHFASYWTAMILANATPRGVCIVHLFPWNSALTAGIVNGWAEGR
jgi:hypothetical protein